MLKVHQPRYPTEAAKYLLSMYHGVSIMELGWLSNLTLQPEVLKVEIEDLHGLDPEADTLKIKCTSTRR